MYVVPGLEFQESYLRYAERRWDLKIHRLPHFGIARLFRFTVFRAATALSKSCPLMPVSAIHNEARRLTGLDWIAGGERKSDGPKRRRWLSFHKGINIKSRLFYPIADWNDRQAFAYLKMHKIPLPPDYRTMPQSFSTALTPKSLRPIRDLYPADWRKILEVFPDAEAVLKREEYREARSAEEGVPVPEV